MTAGAVTGRDIDHRRRLRSAALDSERAARREDALRARSPEVGQPARDGREAPRIRGQPAGVAVEQRARVRVARIGEELADRRLLDHLAGIQHHDLVAELRDNAEMVGNQQDGAGEVATEIAQEVEDLRLERHVERGGGLVRDEEIRLAEQRHGDRDALAHAAGELMGKIVDPPLGIGNADPRQKAHRAGPLLLAREIGVAELHIDHLRADRQHWIERAHGVLEHHGDAPAPERPHGLVRECQNIDAVEADRAGDDAGRGRQQAQHREAQGRFPGAALADQPDDAAALHGESDIAERVDGPLRSREIHREAVDLQERRHLRSPCAAAGRSRRAAPRRGR